MTLYEQWEQAVKQCEADEVMLQSHLEHAEDYKEQLKHDELRASELRELAIKEVNAEIRAAERGMAELLIKRLCIPTSWVGKV